MTSASPVGSGTPVTQVEADPIHIDPNGPLVELNIPKGKVKIFVVDKGDNGWVDWSLQQRIDFAEKNPGLNLDPNNPGSAKGFGNGQQIMTALEAPPDTIDLRSQQQAIEDLANAVRILGPANVLIIGDHGGPGRQQLGAPTSPGRWDYLTPANFGVFAKFVAKKGTLIMTGCDALGDSQDTVKAWYAVAVASDITIIGSVTPTIPQRPDVFRGIWVTLDPSKPCPIVDFQQ